jgi:hypothetical protein
VDRSVALRFLCSSEFFALDFTCGLLAVFQVETVAATGSIQLGDARLTYGNFGWGNTGLP